MIDYNPTAEEAARAVRAFHFGRYKQDAPAPKPEKGNSGKLAVMMAAVKPSPSSKSKRYEPVMRKREPAPLEDLAAKTKRERLTIAQRARRNAERTVKRRAALVRPCPDCGDPINRGLKAIRCHLCAVNYNRKQVAARYVPKRKAL